MPSYAAQPIGEAMDVLFYVLTYVIVPLVVGWVLNRIERRHAKACEHPFVTAQGSPHTRYRRAIEAQSIILAELAARELGRLSLLDALDLVLLYAAKHDPRFQRAARRWVGRLALERDPGLVDLAAAVAALATAPYDASGCRAAIERILRGTVF